MNCPVQHSQNTVDGHAHDHGDHGSCGGGHHAGHMHDHSHALRGDPKAKQKLLLAGLLTAIFMVAEVAGGVISGSLALIADAGHMLTDTAALWLAWYAMHVAERQATDLKTFGLQRAKIVVAYTNALALIAIILWIVIEAVQRLFSPQPILSDTMLLIAGLGLVVNLGCLWLLHGGGNSLNVRGARLHVLGDLLGSIAAVCAAVIIKTTGWTLADPLLSLLMSAVLGFGAYRLLKQSLHILLQGTPQDIALDAVKSGILGAVDGVEDIHHIHIWALDDDTPILTLHATLSASAQPDDRITAIKTYLSQHHKIRHSTVEIEFDACADERVAAAS